MVRTLLYSMVTLFCLGLFGASADADDVPEMVFVSGRIPPKDDRKKPFWKTVRSAQQNLALGRYAWIDCDDLSVGPDGIHYNTVGMVALSNLQAASVYELLKRSRSNGWPCSAFSPNRD